MNEKRTLAAVGGFAFVAAWIGFGFGDALLCLLGAAVALVAVGVLEGKIDLGELQGRFSDRDDGSQASAAAPPPPSPTRRPVRPAGRPRVQ